MENLVKQINYKNFRINIYPDEVCENPREWDNLGTMICAHRNYILGDVQIQDYEDYLHHIAVKFELFTSNGLDYLDVNEKALLKWINNNLIVLPLYLYDHSTLAMSTKSFIGRVPHAEWDSAQCGFIYISKDKIRKKYSVKKISAKLKAQIIQYLINEVKIYDTYIQGNVYGYQIKTSNMDIDSCWGFYGYDFENNGLLDNAKSSIDYYIKEQKALHFNKLKQWIINKVPLQYRIAFSIS